MRAIGFGAEGAKTGPADQLTPDFEGVVDRRFDSYRPGSNRRALRPEPSMNVWQTCPHDIDIGR